MNLTFEQTVTIFGIVMTILGVIFQALYLVRKVTQSEMAVKSSITAVDNRVSGVQNSVDALGEQTTTDMKHLADSQSAAMGRLEKTTNDKIDHHNQIAELRFDELGRRVGRVELTLGGITKVVVFDRDKDRDRPT